MSKKSSWLLAALLVGAAASGSAQEASGVLSVSPIPDGAETRFCYFGGVTYSENALLLIEVPFRREGPDAVQKSLLECVAKEDGSALHWVQTQRELTQGERN